MGSASVPVKWRPPAPTSVTLTLAPLQRGGGDPTQRILPNGTVWRTALTPAGPGSLVLHQSVSGEIAGEAWGPGAEWLADRAPVMLGAGDDASGFAPMHPTIASLWRRLSPARPPATGLIFEALVPAIIEQRVTGVEARQGWAQLVRRYGEPAPGPAPVGMRVFPAPSAWRRIPSWVWHRANVDPGRARTVMSAAAVAHRLDESMDLRRDERLRRLRAIPGVGAWTAAEVAQRAWGDPDEVSVGDFHLPALVGWALLGRPVDDAGMLELLAPYSGHRQRVVRLIELSDIRKPAFGPRMPVGDIRAL